MITCKDDKPDVPLRTLMRAILVTTGPVLTLTAVKQNGRLLFRRVGSDQFNTAAKALEAAQLGSFVTLEVAEGRTKDVFVKKLPYDAQQGVAMNKDLCSIEEYESRFFSPVLASIHKSSICEELVNQGFVPVDFFASHN